MTEASQTLKDMKSNKSPGTSGFNADFTKFFGANWEILL